MWGNIILEISFLTNFHLGFNNTRSDVLIHLTQWQYWWWFWFSFLWALYFLLFMRIFRYRTLKFKPRIATTFRPHGKWGDLIICLLPVSWCINIISNSSFILRMMEWQAESSLFTIRIRGRQWYWVYKYDFKTITDLITVPKNVGHNKWQITTPGDLQTADDYMHILQLRTHNKWTKRYWNEFIGKTAKEDYFNVVSPQELLNIDYNNYNNTFSFSDFKRTLTPSLPLTLEETKFQPWFNKMYNNLPLSKNINTNSSLFSLRFIKPLWVAIDEEELVQNSNFRTEVSIYDDELFNYSNRGVKVLSKNFSKFLKKTYNNFTDNSELGFALNNKNYLYNHENYTEVTRWTKRSQGTISPCRLIKYPLTNQLDSSNKPLILELLRFRFNDDQSSIIHKPASYNNYLVIKQKKYKPLKTIRPWVNTKRKTPFDDTSKEVLYSSQMRLTRENTFVEDVGNKNLRYKLIKKFKKQAENIPLVLWKRLLRTKRTLVLPAHVNINVVTNSFDVIHSWFIPGLGLKMDCIPGRATHHVLHIDNVGFYYGQCAEICGRYHHHMPIRVCALPFEHFLVWWHTFGLTKLMYAKTDQRRFVKTYSLRKYVW